MKKRSITLKTVGLAFAGLGAFLLSGSVLAGMQIDTDGGLTVYDPNNCNYWFRINGRVDIDEIVVTGYRQDRSRFDRFNRFNRFFDNDFNNRRFLRRHRENNFQNGGNIRRGILSLGGGLGEDWLYSLSFDIGRTTQERRLGFRQRRHLTYGFTYLEDAWIGYTGLWDCSRLRIGQFTPITTLDGYGNYVLSNGQMFLEPALATRTFNVPSYINSSSTTMKGLGIILETALDDLFTVAATVYQPAHGPQNNYGNPTRSDRVGTALRVTFSPVHEETCAYHFGIMARYQSLNYSDRSRPRLPGVYNELFFTTPEVVTRNYVGVFESNNAAFSGIPVHATHGSPVLVDAGPLRAKSYNHVAGELAAIWGPMTLEGEYHHVNVQRVPRELANIVRTRRLGRRPERGNVSFHGWHVQGGYILTGESRGYDFAHGAFTCIDPCGYYGAWEVVARYSSVNLIDKEVYGGSENNVTLGLNWYVNKHIKFAFNYIRANIHPTNPWRAGSLTFFTPAKRRLDIFALRAQFVF